MRVGMLKDINFNSGLNIYGTVVFSDRDCLVRRSNVAIWQHDKRVLDTFSLRMRTKGYLGASGQTSDLIIRFGDPNFL